MPASVGLSPPASARARVVSGRPRTSVGTLCRTHAVPTCNRRVAKCTRCTFAVMREPGAWTSAWAGEGRERAAGRPEPYGGGRRFQGVLLEGGPVEPQCASGPTSSPSTNGDSQARNYANWDEAKDRAGASADGALPHQHGADEGRPARRGWRRCRSWWTPSSTSGRS
jgi:hypothetical protein